MNSTKFSIITPIYNGNIYIEKSYSNLVAVWSHYNNFEWILVDDFSPDNGASITAMELVKRCDPIFPIKTIYLDKNYYGAMSTYAGAKVATGDYVLILDQDDKLSPDALLIFEKYITKYSFVKDFVGVCGRCINHNDNVIGDCLPVNELLSNDLYVRHSLRIKGEMFQCTKTSIIMEYFSGMKPGYHNGWVWARISKRYRWLYVNDVVRNYDTANPTSVSNIGVIHYYKNWCTSQIDIVELMMGFIFRDPIDFLKKILIVSRGHFLCGEYLVHKNRSMYLKLLFLIFIPVGGVFALIAKITRRPRYFINH